jgi:hypothetical protein
MCVPQSLQRLAHLVAGSPKGGLQVPVRRVWLVVEGRNPDEIGRQLHVGATGAHDEAPLDPKGTHEQA